jgi:hypothetical protein
MRDAIIRTVLPLIVLGVCSPFAWPQTSKSPVKPRVSELKLQIIPEKETYSLADRLSVRTEFTNITGRTLCFPQPSQKDEVPAQGYVITEAIGPPDTPGEDHFLDHYDGGGTWPLDKLVQEIRERWIWLAPNAVYRTGLAQIRTNFSTPGQWRLEAAYHSPEGSFHPAEFRKYLSTAGRIAGCTVPQSVVSAEPISLSVSP